MALPALIPAGGLIVKGVSAATAAKVAAGAAAAGALAAGGLWGGLPHHVAHLLDIRTGHAQQGQPHLPQDAAGVRGLHGHQPRPQ